MIVLNENEISNIYGMKQAIHDIELMLDHKLSGKIINPSRTVIEYQEKDGSVLYMPSTDLEEKIMSMKAVTIFPKNPSIGKPTTQGIVLLSNASNGEHVAIFNASYLTRLRTGAISAIATKQLSLKDAETMSMIGTGGMAFEQVLGILAVRDIQRIYLINPTKEKAHKFREKLYNFGVNPSIKIEILNNVDEAVSKSQIICCATRSHTPVFNGNYIKAG